MAQKDALFVSFSVTHYTGFRDKMNIQLRFFAGIREMLGTAHELVTLPAHVRTVGDVRDYLRERGGVWAEALAEGRALRMACNQQMTEAKTPITDGCEVAFFPPVTGG